MNNMVNSDENYEVLEHLGALMDAAYLLILGVKVLRKLKELDINPDQLNRTSTK